MKTLGLPFGSHVSALKLMRGLGLNIDIWRSDLDEYLSYFLCSKFGTAYLLEIEKKYAKSGNVREYFKEKQDINWEKFFSDVAITKKENGKEDVGTGIDFDEYNRILISGTDSFYKYIDDFTSYIKEEYPDKEIVLGGPIVRNSTMNFIKNLDCDYINMESCKAYLDYLKDGKIREGFYKKSNGQFEGFGSAGKLKITSPKILEKTDLVNVTEICNIGEEDEAISIHTSDEEYGDFKIIGVSSCYNSCDYCCSKRSLDIPEETWIKTIKDVKEKYELENAVIRIWDDNPSLNSRKYANILSTVSDSFENIRVEGYLDPLSISSKAYKDLFEKFYLNSEHLALFIGRECCDETVSSNIGRKFKGNIRDQKMLDKERENIDKVLDDIKNKEVNHKVLISYIIGPEENHKIYENRIKELEEFKSKSNAEGQFQSLKVLLGTKNYGKYEQKLISSFPGIELSNLDDEFIREFEKLSYKC